MACIIKQPLHSVHGRSLLVTRAELFPNCYLDVYNITYKKANCNGSFCDRTMATHSRNHRHRSKSLDGGKKINELGHHLEACLEAQTAQQKKGQGHPNSFNPGMNLDLKVLLTNCSSEEMRVSLAGELEDSAPAAKPGAQKRQKGSLIWHPTQLLILPQLMEKKGFLRQFLLLGFYLLGFYLLGFYGSEQHWLPLALLCSTSASRHPATKTRSNCTHQIKSNSRDVST
eukprot:scaffold1521_cov271-Chaetoceros_neogracile.AAC.53